MQICASLRTSGAAQARSEFRNQSMETSIPSDLLRLAYCA
ncbi:hypothetical protein MMMB2_2110 [Mycobacterium marinum MB2]|uniref:Uncharacterized protein n=1 Tax=Mycobacterium ulcerans str. Harvey TaxID=1299332 RepID=A0ABP3A8F1_MYCUL|nr:hypothetical protein MMSP_2526 [Mycobacterium sp. 012931]EPQ77448.1 hypothetical protein MMMB2_2110 [Mycobacterium marinum MB2]EUA87692.1 hypothetical protein I551_5848 [Mycobacterium ulcerans str. Harvey]